MQVLCSKSHNCPKSDLYQKDQLAQLLAQRLLGGASDIAQRVFAAPTMQHAVTSGPGACATASPAAVPVMQQLVQLAPENSERCAALAALSVAALAGSQPSDIGFVARTGLRQPRLAAFTNLKALVLPRRRDSSESNALTVDAQQSAVMCMSEAAEQVLRRLRHVDLAGNELGTNALSTAELARQLRQHTADLTFLNLSGNPLHGDRLVFAQSDMPQLKHLDVSSCSGFGSRGAASVSHLAALTHLSLAHADLCEDSLQAQSPARVMAALAQLQSLRHLDLSCTQLQEADIESVHAAAAKRNAAPLWPALTSLRWQSNSADHNAMAASVSGSLHTLCPKLLHLDMSGTVAHENVPHGVLPGTDGAAQLTYLDLAGRRVGSDRLRQVVQSHAATLQQLNVSMGDLSMQVLAALTEAVPATEPKKELIVAVSQEPEVEEKSGNCGSDAKQRLTLRDVEKACGQQVLVQSQKLRPALCLCH